MKSMDEQTSRSIGNLLGSQQSSYNFDIFVKWLNTLKEEYQQRIHVEKNEVELRWFQGNLQILDNILIQIETCKEKLRNGS